MTTALALLWALKSDIEDYSDLRLYVEYEFIKTTQASDVEKLTYYTELKKARRATMQARTSIYFALFAIIFYSVSDKLRWINPSAGFYLSIILVTSIGFSLTRFLAYAIHCKIMYFLFVQNLVVQLRSDDREIDWDKV